MPMHGYQILDRESIEMRTTISQIERDFQVRILVDPAGSSLEIRATSRLAAGEAFLAIQNTLKRKSGQATVWITSVQIKPPNKDVNNLRITFRKIGDTTVRPVSTLPLQILGPNPLVAGAAKVVYRSELEEALNKAANNLRSIPYRMRMRVHFGTVQIHEWKKGQDEISFQELREITQRVGARGTVSIDTM